MSGSHFGSGYWPDDFFGLYFQPEAGGVIIGTLAGSFAGTSAFSGTLEQTSSVGRSGVIRLAESMRAAQSSRWEALAAYFDSVRKKPVEEQVEVIKAELAEAKQAARGVVDPKVVTWKRRATKALRPAERGPALPRTEDVAWRRLVEDSARMERAIMALRAIREEAARARYEQEEEEELLLLAA